MITRTLLELKHLLSRFICWPCIIGSLCIVASIPAPLTRATSVPVASGKSKLLKHDRTRLIEAIAQNKPNVTLVVAARQGMNESLVSEIRGLQGTIQYRDDDVDYLRFELPTRHVLKLSYSPAIESLNLMGKIDYLSDADEDNESPPLAAATEVPPPGRDTPPINPYLPSAAIGAPQFIASHPTFDGRGVVVAVIDTNIDLLLPEFQTAKTLSGDTVPKFADTIVAARNAIVPTDINGSISGYLQIDMQTEITSKGIKLSYRNRDYIVPTEGKYRIGTLNERKQDPADDLNRDGNPDGSNPSFDLLWNESTNTVWVDTNQDFSFADEKPMTDYHVHKDIGIFGKDDPKTAHRETVGFTIQTDMLHKAVFVIPGYGSHGTGVSGSAFGAGFFGGKIDGVAPGAQIISVPLVRGALITASAIEGVITAMKDRRVDLVTIQFGNFVHQNDGSATFSTIADRLISKYQKLIFAAAGNGTDGLNAVLSPADGTEVVAVGSYISKETSRINQGLELRNADNVSGFTSHGPTKDGRVKPNLLAPTDSLTTRPGFFPPAKRYELYSLPPGYQIYGGTSTATPFATAGAALLISAAKQSGVKYDPRRLRWAMMSSARYLPKYSAEFQGAGLLQIQAAWEALKNAPEPIQIISRAPVKTDLSENFLEPNYGAGIFEREGWTAGQSGRRTLNLTRISGKPGPMKLQLRWTGNDGTFAGPAEISLPLSSPVDVSISISPKTSGVHSAILDLVSPDGAVFHQIMNTVVAAEQLNPANNFTISRTGEAEWLHSQSYFVNVPRGTPALRVDVRINEGAVRPSLIRPKGRFYYSLAPDQVPVRYTTYQDAGTWSRVVSNPDPGVWQIAIDNCRFCEKPLSASMASFSVTAALLGVAIQPIDSSLDFSTDLNQLIDIRYRNSYGPVVGEIPDIGLANVFATDVTLSGDQLREFEIDVVPGSSRVGASIAAREGTSADVDLYLFDCTTGDCTLRDFATGTGSSEQVAIDSPTAGKWKVIIDALSAGDHGNSFQYNDYLVHRAFGRMQVQNDSKQVPPGAIITQTVNVKLGAVPMGPRHLEAMLLVISHTGPNTAPAKRSDGFDSYYPDHAVLGAQSIKLKLAAPQPIRR
jgi:hypothetical protein